MVYSWKFMKIMIFLTSCKVNQLFFQRMDTRTLKTLQEKTIKKKNPLTLDVLNLPSRSLLISMPSPSSDYKLYHYTKEKLNIAVYNIEIIKAKLFTNLETYQWRKQTDFPIVKTRYISVKHQSNNPHQRVQVQVFNEYCPLRLNRIYQMSIGQALYLIKECLIGFQRLFNRFGGFDIQETMIAINEKGYCRVWINENFALNQIAKKENKQIKMIHKILHIIESHTTESKASKRLFNTLSQCSNFLQSLKMVDTFIMAQKILVPNRFSLFTHSSKEQKKNHTYNLQNNSHSFESRKSPHKIERSNSPFRFPQDKRNISISPDRKLTNLRNNSPNFRKLKRFKSQNKIPKIESLKVSEGETAYSANNKDVKSSNLGCNFSSRETQVQPSLNQKINSRRTGKWIQESSFLMDFQPKTEPKKQKKELSHSEAMFIQVIQPKDRKYSANNFHSVGSEKSYYKFANTKKSQYDQIKTEISHIIDENESSSRNETPRPIIQQEQQSKKTQHENKIIEQNGWMSFKDFLKVPTAEVLNQSFHSGQEERHPQSEVRLEKLQNLSKRKVAMSILPQDYAQDCL